MAFVPWLTAVVFAPSWITAVCVGIGAVAGEVYRRRQLLKTAFNSAQYILATSAAAAVYVALGGIPVARQEAFRFLPYMAAMISFFVVNSAAVSTVISLHENRSFLSVWRLNHSRALVNDLLALALVYAFAVIVNRFGLVGIVLIGSLLLGLRQLFKVNAQLQTTNRELLEVLVHAIELRDPYTSGHSQRVARYSRVIGRAIGLSAKELERLEIAALLHDVGKIDQMFVPILAKPGRLTPDERSIMELHPIKSAELVQKVTELNDIVLPVRHHHEAWDGSGYPDGLAGGEIPRLARVIVFADTIDAMLTDRPYRKALGRFEVEAELRRCRGTQFDPDMCDCLVSSPQFDELFAGVAPVDRPLAGHRNERGLRVVGSAAVA
ncbi:MAG: HD-GYP domain-containing protein [Gemmatimonadaceae bacterium]|nr:HD-GYP domain-containing protein [Gemmatimonadaceae bacterium]